MLEKFTDAELEAYLDEELSVEDMARVDTALRNDPALKNYLAAINGRRDMGVHSIGAIWRRNRLSCPSREQLGSFLLGILADEQADFIKFHIQKVGCRPCQANLGDLARQQEETEEIPVSRRRKYFESSAGYLRGK